MAFEDPVQFAELHLRRRLWAKQREILHAIATHQSVAVKGCHASGKTFAVAGMVLWWLARHSDGKVITAAPTLRQVKLMWNEVALARRSSRIVFPEMSAVGLRISEERYGIGISSSRGVNVQGFHGGNVLIIADESPGIEADIWDAIEGIRAGGRVHQVKLGNPTVPSGPFFDDFGRNRVGAAGFTISAFDTPNLAGMTVEQLLAMDDEQLEHAPFPFLVRRRWVKEKYQRWGPNHPKYRARVLGEFPTQSAYSVFDLAWIERPKREPTDKERAYAAPQPIQVGIDVAGPGDDETTLCARRGGIILQQLAWDDPDPRGPVCATLRKLAIQGPLVVVVDTVGIGYNFALHVIDQGFQVFSFVAGGRPIDQNQFANCKAEAYFCTREAFKAGYISGLADEECEAQLSGVLFNETPRGLTEIESKDEAKKRGMSSPDRAEALVMAFCKIVPREQTVYFGERVRISPI